MLVPIRARWPKVVSDFVGRHHIPHHWKKELTVELKPPRSCRCWSGFLVESGPTHGTCVVVFEPFCKARKAEDVVAVCVVAHANGAVFGSEGVRANWTGVVFEGLMAIKADYTMFEEACVVKS